MIKIYQNDLDMINDLLKSYNNFPDNIEDFEKNIYSAAHYCRKVYLQDKATNKLHKKMFDCIKEGHPSLSAVEKLFNIFGLYFTKKVIRTNYFKEDNTLDFEGMKAIASKARGDAASVEHLKRFIDKLEALSQPEIAELLVKDPFSFTNLKHELDSVVRGDPLY